MDIQTFYEKRWSALWFEFIKANKTKVAWNGWICENPNLTMEMVVSNPNIAWSGYHLSLNPNLTMDAINRFPNIFDHKWSWENISRHKNITFDDVLANPDYPWDWNELSSNPNVTMEDTNAYPEKPWVFRKLCSTKCPTMRFSFDGYDNGVSYNELSQKIQSEDTDIREWHAISHHKYLTMELITTNSDKPWVWSSICHHAFVEDKKCFVEWNVKWILLAKMHEELDEECEDLVKMVAKY
jgi:hypothetical protein